MTEIVHQLPGRVRMRIPELCSSEYRQKLLESFSGDARITDVFIKEACCSLTVYYDAQRLNLEDVSDFVSRAKKTKQPATGEKLVPAGGKPPAAEKKGAAKAAPAETSKEAAPHPAPKKPGAARKGRQSARATKKEPAVKKKESPRKKRS
jgi:hypothetical protein